MTTPSHHPDRRRARELDPVDDVTREFWGPGADWPTTEQPVVDSGLPEESHGLGSAVRRWWNTTGAVPATRSHRAPAAATGVTTPGDDTDELGLDDWLDAAFTERSDRSSAPDVGPAPLTREQVDRDPGEWSSADWVREHELDDWSSGDDPLVRRSERPVGPDVDQDDQDDGWDAPVAPPRGGVDPLLARLGGLAVIVTLLVPVVLGFASGSDDDDALRTAPSPPAASDADVPIEPPAASSAADTSETVVEPDVVAAAAPPAAAEPSTAQPTTAATTTAAPAATSTAAAVVAPTEQLTVDTCALEYEIAGGDFWIRIADGSGVALADLLAANDATVSTPLFPGSTICLPAGATTPSPPPAPTPTADTDRAPSTPAPAPTPTRPPTPSPTTTAPPTTSPPPPPPPPASNASAAEVQAIIRAVWPDELEERALQVAWRESNYIPTAKNFCCYGVFQIYWSVHQGWLADMGVTSAEQLYDPTVNARAALVLYQRAGGWGPWGG